MPEHIDYLNSNSLRSYPIKEGISKTSTDTVFSIPDSFIVEFILSATSVPAARFYISRITNLQESITVEITEKNDAQPCGSFVIDMNAHTLYKDYYLQPNNSLYPKANGKLTVAYLEDIQNLPAGSFYFTIDTAEFETKTIIPSLVTLNSITFIDNVSGISQTLTGKVSVLARNNLRFTATTNIVSNDAIILDAGDGLGLNKDCEDVKPCIKTINSIAPDGSGDFTISVADCADLSSLETAAGLLLSDTCCKPCMGCDEISELTERLMQLETDLIKLRDLFSNLQSLIAEFTTLMNFSCEC